ncbi:MAG: 16S rRNA (cytidine(1402)-2'-O)-methyltransferase [Deltaproteobacteria bacterium RIFOXYD12_FULL_57_12]|nr:MAG: 16S rRNA (cytidine(1402)-2'-O)-methyltransferase [Deltaproteobacteria bacterium RIFOXYD12_FULL_57_12]
MPTKKNKKQEHTPLPGRPGVLYVIATPIGNLEDITLRAVRILGEVDVIAAEDTRHTRKLLAHLGISTPLVSYFKDKEQARSEKIIRMLLTGRQVGLVSDAGTPGISDPGAILVKAALEAGIRVIPIPGPSALTAALCVAGFPDTSFVFLGFLPSRATARRLLLNSLRQEERDLVFYESPRRLAASLAQCLEILGDRQVFWARELTKLHEELRTAQLTELAAEVAGREIKGESVLIVKGAAPVAPPPATDLTAALRWHHEQDYTLKEAVQRVSRDLGLPRSQVYQEALAIWNNR